MSKSAKPTARFRALLARRQLTMMPSVGDAFSARLVASEGFEAIMSSGNATSATLLGLPDIGLMTMMENAQNAGRIAAASGLPTFADADTGYGNALSVRRTIMEFERAGVAAIMIEDQVTPKRCGMLAGKQVVTAAEMEMKIKAALDARADDDLVLCARTDARAVEGLESAIARAQVYQRAGADVIFVEGPRTIEEAQEVARNIDIPLLYNVTPTGSVPALNVEALEAMKYKLLICSVYPILAAIPGIQSFLRTLKMTGDVAKAGANAATMAEYLDILGFQNWQKYEGEYAIAPDKG
jgi:2-methylisocitrate lyase-like PEP mutase family enzyme